MVYGCSPAKLAKTLGKPEKDGQKLYDMFWELNPGIGKFRDALIKFWETTGEKKWIPSIDGTKIMTRKKNAIINSLFQSAGAIIMDFVCCLMDTKLGKMYLDEDGLPYYLYKGYKVSRIGYFHDELEFECQKGIGKEIADMIVQCIVKAGEYFKTRVPLAGEGVVGANWKETH